MLRKWFGRFSSHALALNSAIVFVGSMGANVASYVYHLLMGRLLGPAGYGEISSLFSLLYLFTVPLLVGQTVLVKFVSGYKARNELGKAKSLFLHVTRLCIISSIFGFPLIILGTPVISGFLHLSSPIFAVLVYLLFIFSLFTVAATSILQGFQKFIWVSLIAASAIVVKVVFSIPLSYWGVQGALWAAVIANVLIYAICFVPLRFMLSKKQEPTMLHWKEAARFAAPTLFTLLGLTSIYTTDIILVRHFFSAKDAGLYAAIAILGKVIFYASSAVSTVLYPVLSERSVTGGSSNKLVMWATGMVGMVSFVLTGIYFMFPNIIIGLLFGSQYHVQGNLLGLFGLFIAIYSVANILVMACLGLGKMKVFAISMICALGQIVGVIVFHGSLATVLYINIIASTLLVVCVIGYYLRVSNEKI